MKRLLSFLALCLPIYILAQGFGSFTHDQPYFAKDRTAGSGEPGTNILFLYTNMYRWWVASDIPVGVTVSNQWSDRIVGAKMDQMNLTLSPTNSADGVYFPGTHYLTNVALNIGGSASRPMFLFVMKPENPPTAKWLWGGAPGPATGFWMQNNRFMYLDAGFGTKQGNPTLTENVLLDFLMHEQDFYTNGVLNKTNLADNLGGGAPVDKLGYGTANPTFYYKGYIREIIVWTNTGITRPLDAGILSNLHWYTTNRYQYSP